MILAFGILADLSLLAGIVLFLSGFQKKYVGRRALPVLTGAVLLSLGIWFGAWDMVGTADENGYGAEVNTTTDITVGATVTDQPPE